MDAPDARSSPRSQRRADAAASGSSLGVTSRFPRLDECAHFHYEHFNIGPLKLLSEGGDVFRVHSNGQNWALRRSCDNFRTLDGHLHRCVYDRRVSRLRELTPDLSQDDVVLAEYAQRFSELCHSLINCASVLNWLELDNRGNRLVAPPPAGSPEDPASINRPAVAAAYVTRAYIAQAPDELSFEVGDMVSVIDMPPPEESTWWRGKKGFQVGFFPCECVELIGGDKVPQSIKGGKVVRHTKPVLRRHGKLIAFFRSFLLSRPSRQRLKQSGMLRERVFGCDLGEHLQNTGREVPLVLKYCTELLEDHGIVDGIYRLSGISSNIQKLRLAFDDDRVPTDDSIRQDIHSVASLLKLYFRELPNPLLTYQLYHKFMAAVQTEGERSRLASLREVVRQLPPPHHRTLEYLLRHLSRVAALGSRTGMTTRNVAIVWAPNLLRSREGEIGGIGALHVVGVQAVLTEYLIRYVDVIFGGDNCLDSLFPSAMSGSPGRPRSLPLSSKLLSLEEAQSRGHAGFIDVGGGPASLPTEYHTILALPARRRAGGTKAKRSPSTVVNWKAFFSKGCWHRHRTMVLNMAAAAPPAVGCTSPDATKEESSTPQATPVGEEPASQSERLDSSDATPGSSSIEYCLLTDTAHSTPVRSLPPGRHARSLSHDSYFHQDSPLLPRSAGPILESSQESLLPPHTTVVEVHSTAATLSQTQSLSQLDSPACSVFSESGALTSGAPCGGPSSSLVTPDSPTMGNISDLRTSSSSSGSKLSPHDGTMLPQQAIVLNIQNQILIFNAEDSCFRQDNTPILASAGILQQQTPPPAASSQAPPLATTYHAPPPATTYQAPSPAATYQAPPLATTYHAPPPATTYQAPPPATTFQAPAPTFQAPPPAATFQAPLPVASSQRPLPATFSKAPPPATTFQATVPSINRVDVELVQVIPLAVDPPQQYLLNADEIQKKANLKGGGSGDSLHKSAENKSTKYKLTNEENKENLIVSDILSNVIDTKDAPFVPYYGRHDSNLPLFPKVGDTPTYQSPDESPKKESFPFTAKQDTVAPGARFATTSPSHVLVSPCFTVQDIIYGGSAKVANYVNAAAVKRKVGLDHLSPMSPIEESRRRFESEIGRAIVRDRRMRVEMERIQAEVSRKGLVLKKEGSHKADPAGICPVTRYSRIDRSPDGKKKAGGAELRRMGRSLERPCSVGLLKSRPEPRPLEKTATVRELLSRFEARTSPRDSSRKGTFLRSQLVELKSQQLFHSLPSQRSLQDDHPTTSLCESGFSIPSLHPPDEPPSRPQSLDLGGQQALRSQRRAHSDSATDRRQKWCRGTHPS